MLITVVYYGRDLNTMMSHLFDLALWKLFESATRAEEPTTHEGALYHQF